MGNLPSGWQIKSLGELFHIYPGGTPSRAKDEFWHGEIPWVKISDMLQGNITSTDEKISEKGLANSSAKIIPKGSLLISIFATVGRTAFLEIDAATNQAIVGLVPKDKFLSKNFIRYYLDSEVEEIKKESRGVAQSNINKSILSNIRIPLPPLPIQKQIAEILEKADQAKQKRKEANQLTEQFLQSAFIEMFGDPVKNPKGWEKVAIGRISSLVTSGSTPLGGNSNYFSNGVLFIRSQNILMNKIDYSDMVFISKEIHAKMKRTWVKDQDVLLNITGASIGRVAYFTGDDNSANVNQHVCIIRVIREFINHIYLSYLIASNSFQKKTISNNSGATRQAFNFEQIKNFEIILPPLSLQLQFAELVQKTEVLKEKQKASEQELENLFNSLIQKAFRGELVT